MSEQVATGGLKTFYYPRNQKTQLQDARKKEIREAYEKYHERKNEEKRNKKLAWIIALIIILLIILSFIVYYIKK